MPPVEKEVHEIFERIYSPKNEKEANLNISLQEGREIQSRSGYLWPEVQLKFFEVFSKEVIKKIFIEYSKGVNIWIPDEVQLKILEFFTKEEAKELLLCTEIRLCNDAQMFVYENYGKEDAMQILAHNALICSNVMQKILARPDAKEYLLEFLNHDGGFAPSIFDGPQMLIVKHFSEEDATEILLKVLHAKENGDNLSEPAMKKILDTFSKENAKKLMMVNIDECDGYIWPETLSRFIDVFSKEDAKELLLAYMKNDAEYETDLQKKILISFSKDDAKELLLADIKNGESFDDDVLLRIIDMMPSADAKELISTYMPGEELGDEVILNIMAGMDKKDAKELLRQYKREGGKLCKEAQLFLGYK